MNEDIKSLNTTQEEPLKESEALAKTNCDNSIVYVVIFLAFLIFITLLLLIKKKLKKPTIKPTFEPFKNKSNFNTQNSNPQRVILEDKSINISLDILDQADEDIQTDTSQNIVDINVVEQPLQIAAFSVGNLYSNEDFSLLSTDALDFVKDRISELEITSDFTDRQIEKWAFNVITFLFELKVANKSNFIAANIAPIFARPFKEELEKRGFEIIDEPKWNPSLQRAIVVKEDSDIEEDTLDVVSSLGLKKAGKILQKQEVILLKRTIK